MGNRVAKWTDVAEDMNKKILENGNKFIQWRVHIGAYEWEIQVLTSMLHADLTVGGMPFPPRTCMGTSRQQV